MLKAKAIWPVGSPWSLPRFLVPISQPFFPQLKDKLALLAYFTRTLTNPWPFAEMWTERSHLFTIQELALHLTPGNTYLMCYRIILVNYYLSIVTKVSYKLASIFLSGWCSFGWCQMNFKYWWSYWLEINESHLQTKHALVLYLQGSSPNIISWVWVNPKIYLDIVWKKFLWSLVC